MYKIIPIQCKTCGETFTPKSERNKFCKRSCFKKDFYHRKKAEELNRVKFPSFTCPSCQGKITLDFDPVKEGFKWLKFSCPHCSTLMINVSELIATQDSSIS